MNRSNLSVNTDAHVRPLPAVAPLRGRRLRLRYASRLRRAVGSVCLVLLSFPAISSGDPSCSQVSGAAEGECLQQVLATEERSLSRVMTSLRAGIARHTFWHTSQEMNRDARERVLKALSEADTAWRRLVAAECGDLLDGSYTGGNGGINAGLRCTIDRTRSRLVDIRKSEPYQWIATK